MSARRSRLAGGLAAAALLALGTTGALGGQEPEEEEEPAPTEAAQDTARPPGLPPPEDRPRRRGCALQLDPKPSTNLHRIQRAGAFVYYIGGGMLWRCGNAEMEADSAVRYEAARRVEMMGNVDYRDTIRILTSEALTYYELPDLVIATDDVRLTRTETGSTLRGPRVEFLRAVSGREELTTATGRPHLTLIPTADYEGDPFEVDADVTELAGEEMARARGDVVIRRPDLLARADSAVFDIREGGGVLYGEPEVEGSGFRLSGDTIRLRFEEDELREVWARGRAFAAGETFEVVAEQIRARIERERAREVWAYGGERSLALSDAYRVYGDSLRFALSAGQIDSVVSVGRAIAEEDPAAEEAEGRREPGLAARPGTAAGGPDTTTVEPEATFGEEAAPAQAVDSAAVRRVERSRPDTIPAPTLELQGGTSWMTGDTLVAVFEPVPPEARAEAVSEADAEAPAPEGAGGADPHAAPRDSAGTGDHGASAAPDSAGRRLERIRVSSADGAARAYYAAAMDSTRTEPSRNYVVGRAIVIRFEEGAVIHVTGERAIGVHLDPGEGEAGAPEERTAEEPADPPPDAGDLR